MTALMLTAGRIVRLLLSLGLPLGPLRLLGTQGRHTGNIHEIPIAVLKIDCEQWIVSPFGQAGWVHNVRENGVAYLRRGRDTHQVHLAPADEARVPELLRAYRRRFAAVPFVRAAFRSTGRDPLEAFAGEAQDHPVFSSESIRPD